MEAMLKDMGGRKARKKVVRGETLLEKVLRSMKKETEIERYESLAALEFGEEKLCDVIKGLAFVDEDPQKKGSITGCMLSILSRQTYGQRIYINGDGIEFPYLFLGGKSQELIIDNFKGDYIANRLKAEKLLVANCEGRYIAVVDSNTKYVINCKNTADKVHWIGGNAGKPHRTPKVLLANNTGWPTRLNYVGLGVNIHTFPGLIDDNPEVKQIDYEKPQTPLFKGEERYGFSDAFPGRYRPIRYIKHLIGTGYTPGKIVKLAKEMQGMNGQQIMERADHIMRIYEQWQIRNKRQIFWKRGY